MNRVRLNIMKKGDRVLSVNGERISIMRRNGEVDVLRFFVDEKGLIRMDEDNKLTIGYGDGTVEVCCDEKIKVETF